MAQKKEQNNLVDTIRNNYVSAIIGLIIVLLGIGYISNSLSTKNKELATDTDQKQEQIQGEINTISGRTYKVQKGDTLWSIAEAKYQSGYNFTDIVVANKLKNANDIKIGQTLTLPDVPAKIITVKKAEPTLKAVVKPTVKVTVVPTMKPSTTPVPTQVIKKTTPAKITITGTSYTIVKGDNLWTIAVRAYGDGYKWTKIWNANKKMISNPDLIFSGNKLVLPR